MTDKRSGPVPSFDLAGKRALITGGSRDRARRRRSPGRLGAHVTLARPSADLDAGIENLKDGHSADALELDVNDTAGVRADFGARAYNILVNNAGTNQPVTFLEVTEAQYDTIMTLNVRACVLRRAGRGPEARGCRAAGIDHQRVLADGACRRRDPHRLLCLEVGHGRHDARHGGRSCAARHPCKHALPDLHRNAAGEPVPRDEEFSSQVLCKIKLGRVGQVGDLTGAFVYLASDASSLMTGSSIDHRRWLDGRLTILACTSPAPASARRRDSGRGTSARPSSAAPPPACRGFRKPPRRRRRWGSAGCR